MNLSLWKWLVILFWMSVVSGIVLGLSFYFDLPEQIAGPLLFIAIGISVSGGINYYKR